MFSSQRPGGIREKRMARGGGGQEDLEGSRAVETRTKSEIGSRKAEDRL